MPFVTEALWAALPHRASRSGAAHRGPLAGRRRARRWPPRPRSDALDRAHRRRDPQRARLGASCPRPTGCETFVYVPVGARARRFEALRPAVERLGRARPLRRRADTGGARRRRRRPRRPVGRRCRRRDRGGHPAGRRRRRRCAAPSSAPASSASWPRPRAGSRPPVTVWRTRSSCRRRRRRSSTAPGRAKRSSPSRSSALEGPSGALNGRAEETTRPFNPARSGQPFTEPPVMPRTK